MRTLTPPGVERALRSIPGRAVLLISALCGGCLGPSGDMHSFSEAQGGQPVTMQVGDTLSLRVDQHVMPGGWEVQPFDQGVLEQLPTKVHRPSALAGIFGGVGQPTELDFRFKASAPGSSPLVLAYVGYAEKTLRYEVTVLEREE